jgi:glycogen synthase
VRILHLLDHSAPLHSGYAFRTLAILREQRARGWDTVQLTTPRHGRSDELEQLVDGTRFLRTPFAPGLLSKIPAAGAYLDEMSATTSRLDRVVRELRPDVLQPHSPVLNAIPAIRVGRRHAIPVVYEVRASWEDAAVDHGTTTEGSLRYRLSRTIETWAVRNADAVTTICDGLRADLLARGLPESKVTVIGNAVDIAAFEFGREGDPALRAQLGLDGKTVVGFAGSFYGYEGLDLLLDAIARLSSARPELRALLVGGGPQDQALREQATRLGIADRVIFTGRVPHAQVQRYYELIDVLAYPRHSMRLTELVTPLKPLEAMAQGRVLVASDVGGHRELIRHRQTGVLFKASSSEALAEALAGLLDDRSLWPALAANGRRYVESERNWTRTTEPYARLYAGLLARNGAAAPVSAVSGG